MLKNITVQDIAVAISGFNRDGELLPVSIIKSCFSDLKQVAIEIYNGSGVTKYLSRDEERKFFMAYNASRIHMSNHISGLDPNEDVDHLALIYEIIIEARNDLSLCNNGLVRKCINKFYSNNFGRNNSGYVMQKREECFGDAYDGLLNAVRMFDYARGNKFSTYAYMAINHSLYKVPRDDPSLSLSDLGCDGAEFDLRDCVVEEQSEQNSEKMDIISDIIYSGFNNPGLEMSEMDRDILRLHVDPRNSLTNIEIGRIFNLNRETVRMRKIKGLKKVESYIKRKLVKK